MGYTRDEKLVHLDAYGLKVLFNHGIRRFMTTAKNRVPKLSLLSLCMFYFVRLAKAKWIHV